MGTCNEIIQTGQESQSQEKRVEKWRVFYVAVDGVGLIIVILNFIL